MDPEFACLILASAVAGILFLSAIVVRDRLASYEGDPGWYHHPTGTVARVASAAELRRDGIEV